MRVGVHASAGCGLAAGQEKAKAGTAYPANPPHVSTTASPVSHSCENTAAGVERGRDTMRRQAEHSTPNSTVRGPQQTTALHRSDHCPAGEGPGRCPQMTAQGQQLCTRGGRGTRHPSGTLQNHHREGGGAHCGSPGRALLNVLRASGWTEQLSLHHVVTSKESQIARRPLPMVYTSAPHPRHAHWTGLF